tara:strand:- start:1889 stop:2059 length:171 start_codon:yes stop_codon:yes gene_type:complete
MSLMAYYQSTFALMQHHGYSLSEIDGLIPWEREVYLEMLKEHLEEQEKQRQAQMRQ